MIMIEALTNLMHCYLKHNFERDIFSSVIIPSIIMVIYICVENAHITIISLQGRKSWNVVKLRFHNYFFLLLFNQRNVEFFIMDVFVFLAPGKLHDKNGDVLPFSCWS